MRFLFTCSTCGKQIPFHCTNHACDCGGSFTVEYDLERVGRSLTKDSLMNRTPGMWRYAELLPVEDGANIVTLGEGGTPLLRMSAAERELPLAQLWVKREEQNPTGSFKARGFSVALSVAKEHRIKAVAVNSNGNAASAMAAYAGAAGMEAYAFIPRDCPGLIVQECVAYGARTSLVDGLIQDAGRIVQEGADEQGWHNVGTLREPGRVEGKKTMGLELAEQFGWRLPDVIIYPTGGGSGVIGMWNAFDQLRRLGWIAGDLPRIVCVQEEGCRPLADAMAGDAPFEPANGPVTSGPTGMRVPHPPDGELLVSIMKRTGGTAVAVSGGEIEQAQQAMGRQGISASPEGAATWAALMRLIGQGWVGRTDRVVLFNTCHAMKYWPWRGPDRQVVKTYEEWRESCG